MRKHFILALALLCSCIREELPEVQCGPDGNGRSQTATLAVDMVRGGAKGTWEEEAVGRISDVNVFIYCGGSLYEDGSGHFTDAENVILKFPSEEPCDVFFLANTGPVSPPLSERELHRIHIGLGEMKEMPMAAAYRNYVPGSRKKFLLQRLYAEYTLCLRKTSEAADYTIKSVSLQNSALDVSPFENESKATESGPGDFLDDEEIRLLNEGGEVRLYCPENMRGYLLPEGVGVRAPRALTAREAALCTYLEVHADVRTPTSAFPDCCFRMYLGEDLSKDFNVRRNTSYRLTPDFASDMIEASDWDSETGPPEVIGSFELSSDEASVISGVSDIIYLYPRSGNGKDIRYRVVSDRTAQDSISCLSYPTTHKRRKAIALQFSTTKRISGLAGYGETIPYTVTHYKVISEDSFDGKPVLEKDITVKTYTHVFPVFFRTLKREDGHWDLCIFADNPMQIGLSISYEAFNGDTRLYSGSIDACRRLSSRSLQEYGEAPGTGGLTVGSLGREEEYGAGMILNVKVSPPTGDNLVYPRMTCDTLYMGEGTRARLGPGPELYPGCLSGVSDNPAYYVGYRGTPKPGAWKDLEIHVGNAGYEYIFLINSLVTGFNRSREYSLTDFNGSPFHFENGGLTLSGMDIVREDARYLDDSARDGVLVYGYEPGRDLGMIRSEGAKTGALIGKMIHFFGNKHSWLAWRGYDYRVYMTINGCTDWPGSDESPAGYCSSGVSCP